MPQAIRTNVWLLVVTAFCALGIAGCATRIVEFSSEPTGAVVYVDGSYAGRTPMTLRYLKPVLAYTNSNEPLEEFSIFEVRLESYQASENTLLRVPILSGRFARSSFLNYGKTIRLQLLPVVGDPLGGWRQETSESGGLFSRDETVRIHADFSAIIQAKDPTLREAPE